MTLCIEKESRIDDIKKAFTDCYPFLKIEFYKRQFSSPGHPEKKEIILSSPALMQLANLPDKKFIDISSSRTVGEVENAFAVLGLIAEIFRKSGNVWVETSLTSDWTLQQQNLEGEEITRHFTKKHV